MAKAKKVKLTIEDVIVTKDRQLYKVPENWCWTTLQYVCSDFIVPQRDKPKVFDGEIPWCRIEDIEGDFLNGTLSGQYVSEDTIKKMNLRVCPEGTVICSCSASLGIQAILTRPCCTNQTFIGLVCNSTIQKKYLFWYLRSQGDYFEKIGTGTTIKYISKDKFKKMNIPLPPLVEQQLIVEQIENLFSKLDEAKSKLQVIIDGYENRKEAILYSAFEGKLSKKWREEHLQVIGSEDYLTKLNDERDIKNRFTYEKREGLPKTWCSVKIDKFIYFAGRIGWKGLKAEEYVEEGPLFLSVYNLNYGDYVDYRDAHHITEERYEESPEIMLKEEDILLAKDGAGIGKIGFVKELPDKATVNSSLLVIRAGESIYSKYLYYYFLGPKLQRLAKERISGSATPHLFQKDIKEFMLPVPPKEEQLFIAATLESMLEREQIVYDNAQNVIENIDFMKKSILAKAFREELGTNNPDEESSIELLKSIIETE